MVRADGPRPLAPGCHSPVMGRRDGPWGTRAAMGRKAGGRACLLWVLWMDRRVSCVSIVFRVLRVRDLSACCGLCVCRMGPRTAVSYVPYVSLLRSMRACKVYRYY